MSDLDKDFDKIAEQINAKIQEAAEALKAANELATKAGVRSLHVSDEYWDYISSTITPEQVLWQEVASNVSFVPVIQELNKAGWHTSALDC
jgi:hypothetical protein